MRTSRALAAAPIVALLTSTAGCASGPAWNKTSYQNCLASPESYGSREPRSGWASPHGLDMIERGYDPKPDHPGFKITLTQKDCLDTITIVGPGRETTEGPAQPVDGHAFAANYEKNRLAFYFYRNDHEAYVWIDGEKIGPYSDIMMKPYFSANGEHVAYAATESGGEEVLFIDGAVYARNVHPVDYPFFYLLDDGTPAWQWPLPNDKYEVFVGKYASGPLDEVCGFVPGAKGRWALTAKSAAGWSVLVDGKVIDAHGIPTGCDVAFSKDGRHYAFVTAPPRQAPGDMGVVLDGDYRRVDASGGRAYFMGEIPVAELSRPVPGASNAWETIFDVLGIATPAPPPTDDDDYAPPADASPRWRRVRLGSSLGPKLDVVHLDTLQIDQQGHVRYDGDRGSRRYTIVDNVLQDPDGAAVKPR